MVTVIISKISIKTPKYAILNRKISPYYGSKMSKYTQIYTEKVL